jgi:2-iminobutanoate/2-iminopropanoate deaminase
MSRMEGEMDSERRGLIGGAMAGAVGLAGAGLASASAAAQGGPPQPKFIQHEPVRAYAKAVVFGNLVFVSGEDCTDPKTREVRGVTCEEQTEFLFQNMQATLQEAGSSLAHVIKMTALLKDLRDQPGYSKVKAKYLPHKPASTSFGGAQLSSPRVLIEIEAIAVIPA